NIMVGSGLTCVKVSVARFPVIETLNCPSHMTSGTQSGSITSGFCDSSAIFSLFYSYSCGPQDCPSYQQVRRRSAEMRLSDHQLIADRTAAHPVCLMKLNRRSAPLTCRKPQGVRIRLRSDCRTRHN